MNVQGQVRNTPKVRDSGLGIPQWSLDLRDRGLGIRDTQRSLDDRVRETPKVSRPTSPKTVRSLCRAIRDTTHQSRLDFGRDMSHFVRVQVFEPIQVMPYSLGSGPPYTLTPPPSASHVSPISFAVLFKIVSVGSHLSDRHFDRIFSRSFLGKPFCSHGT